MQGAAFHSSFRLLLVVQIDEVEANFEPLPFSLRKNKEPDSVFSSISPYR